MSIKIGSTVVWHRKSNDTFTGFEHDIGVVTDIITGPPSPGAWLSEAEIFFQKERKKIQISIETLIDSDNFSIME